MTFKINLQDSFIEALSRRHNGSKHTQKEINDTYERLKYLYKQYNKNREKENYLLNEYWEKEKIEENFGSKKFYNAHIRLRRCRNNMLKFHKYMFCSLVHFDGNSESFNQYTCISPTEIMEDFESKYIRRNNV